MYFDRETEEFIVQVWLYYKDFTWHQNKSIILSTRLLLNAEFGNIIISWE